MRARTNGIRAATCVVAIATSVAAAPSARASDPPRPTATLDVRLERGAEMCPAGEAIASEVATRLGYPAIVDVSDKSVSVVVRRDGDTLKAWVSVRDADGVTRRREPIASKSADCTSLAASIALTISIAIDPMSLTRSTPRAEAVEPARATPQAAPPIATPSPAIDTPREERATRTVLDWRASVGAIGSVGALPAPSFGPSLSAGVGVGAWSIDFEGSYHAPASRARAEGGAVSASLLVATIAPCWQPRPLAVCGLLSAGAMFGQGSGVDVPAETSTAYAAAGVRAAAEVPIGDRFGVALRADGLTPLRTTTLRIVHADVWTTPPLYASLGLAAVAHLR